MTKIVELYGRPTGQSYPWPDIVAGQKCSLLNRKCLKNRKSEPDVSIGTCTVSYGRDARNIIICPFRLLEAHPVPSDVLVVVEVAETSLEYDREEKIPRYAQVRIPEVWLLVAVIVLVHTQRHFCCQGLIVQAAGFSIRMVDQLWGCFFE